MRIGFINEGTYPIVKGGVSTWCDQLLHGLPEHTFDIITLAGNDQQTTWPIPANVRSVAIVPMWHQVAEASTWAARREQRQAIAALRRFWEAALPAWGGASADLEEATAALKTLATQRRRPLLQLLADGSASRIIMSAYRHHAATHGLPPLTMHEAAQANYLTNRMLAVMDTQLNPDLDLLHPTANGPSALVALAHHWRHGTPILLTEHGVYLRERYLGLANTSFSRAARYAIMAAIRTVCQIAYSTAAHVCPVSDFNGRWAKSLGAPADRITTIHNGVDPAAFTQCTESPTVPTVSFVGRIDPLKDLETLIRAFGQVRTAVPDAKLRLFGPTPNENADYRHGLEQLIDALSLRQAVTFEGPCAGSQPAIAAGHVVALSSISEGLPFTVMEAMMRGRPTVNTDVGGVHEVVGSNGVAGVVVPPRDPEAFATALVALLNDHTVRDRMGANARDRALQHFTLEDCCRRYGRMYTHVARPYATVGHVIDLTTPPPLAHTVADPRMQAAS